jgi:hypothetical protein
MSDTAAEIPATPAPKIGDAWGDDISGERKRWLDERLGSWDAETDHGNRLSPFGTEDYHVGYFLTGAEVFYLAARSLIGTKPNAPNRQQIATVDAARAALSDPDLRTILDLRNLNIAGANLERAHLESAFLREAGLEHVNLRSALLAGANLYGAHLMEANLSEAQLSSADLSHARLEGADLRYARLDRETRLNHTHLSGVSLDQIVLDNANMTVVSWEGVAPLGDELVARAGKQRDGRRKSEWQRTEEYEAAVRANRLLATALRSQGLAEDADVFAYRAQLIQRGLRFQRWQFGRWFVSWGLALLSGYGYKLGRIFAAYAIVVLTFAALFLLPTVLNGTVPTIQQTADAMQISLNAIHGRVFFVQFGLDTLQSWLATAESVIGIVIEGVFVAMIIQRLFR